MSWKRKKDGREEGVKVDIKECHEKEEKVGQIMGLIERFIYNEKFDR
jgi:hypothetical protein